MIRIQEWIDKYNPFNSLKALSHVEYWRQIKNGVIPPPRFISIDPSGVCNFKCPHCNAWESLKSTKADRLSIEDIDKIIEMLADWKTRAVCIGGGGESLTNQYTGYLIDLLVHKKIRIGVVTNGSLIQNFIPHLQLCEWLGVSMDAATPETYSKMKGMPGETFNAVIENIARLTSSRIGHRKPEVTYKFLIHPSNCHEIYEAARIAKDAGCDLIHLRPGAAPWFNIDYKGFHFSESMVDEGKRQIESARADFEDESFKVYGVMHKFTMDWIAKKSFQKCYAGYVTCFVSSNGTIGLCCDRRGDSGIELCHINDYKEFWGSERHKKIVEAIEVSRCPRCTYCHVNEIFENVVLDDRMMCDFI